MKHIVKKSLSYLFIISLVIFTGILMAIPVLAEVPVTSFDELERAIGNAGVEPDIVITKSFTFTNTITIPAGVTVNLTTDNLSGVTLSIVSGRHFKSDRTGVSMTIGTGITLDGCETGGGIEFSGAGSSLTLNGCTITKCKGGFINGGGVQVSGNANGKSTITINNGTLITKCSATSGGGGVYGSNYCDIIMNGGTITNNYALMGGGITSQNWSTIELNGGDIIENTAGDGAGVYVLNSILSIRENSTIVISRNKANLYGGGIILRETLNTPYGETRFIMYGGTIQGNEAYDGGGIYVYSSNENGPITEFTLTGGSIMENEAPHQGGGIYVNNGHTLKISGGAISTNTAGSGGGIFVNGATAEVSGDAKISGNKAGGSGGGIYGYTGSYTIISGKAQVIANEASNGGGIAIISYGITSTLTVKESALISDNKAVNHGGGIWTYNGYAPAPIVNITGGTISNNNANYGGGISMGKITGYIPELNITGGTINNNTATTDGGGIIAEGSAVTISNCEITNNTATNGNGGGMYIFKDSTLTINTGTTGTTITGNTELNGHGGGIFTEDTPSYANLTIDGSTFFDNNEAKNAYAPPENAYSTYSNIRFDNVSIADHPLNDYDINYESGSLLLFKVTYNANDGTGSHEDTSLEPGKIYTILTSAVAGIGRAGYTFVNWNTAANGTGTAYAPGNTITLNSDVTLYAQWEIIPTTTTTTTSTETTTEPTSETSSTTTTAATTTTTTTTATTTTTTTTATTTTAAVTTETPPPPSVIIPIEEIPEDKIVHPELIPDEYVVVKYDDNIYVIYDEEGLPIGYIVVPEGKTIDEMTFEDMIPFGESPVPTPEGESQGSTSEVPIEYETTGTPTPSTPPPPSVIIPIEEIPEDRIVYPELIPNEYIVVKYDDDMYVIYDDEGVPLGYLVVPEGMTIDEMTLEDMIPLGAPPSPTPTPEAEGEKENPLPTTGGMIMIPIVIIGAIIAAIGIVLYTSSKKKRVNNHHS